MARRERTPSKQRKKGPSSKKGRSRKTHKSAKKRFRIGMIVEDEYYDAYRTLAKKIAPNCKIGSPKSWRGTIPATDKLRRKIQDLKKTHDFALVLVDLDTPMHRKDPQYFQNLQKICKEEEAALLIVKKELESWILADVNSLARWKKKKVSLPNYSNTARDPSNPKKAIKELIQNKLSNSSKKSKRKVRSPSQSLAQIVEHMVIDDETLKRNGSLRCFHDLVKGCCGEDGEQYFENYPQEKHCNSPKIPY